MIINSLSLFSNWNISEYSFDFYAKWNTIGKSMIIKGLFIYSYYQLKYDLSNPWTDYVIVLPKSIKIVGIFWQLLLIGSSINTFLSSYTEIRKHYKPSILAAAKDKKWREKIILLTFKVIYRDTSNENQLQNCMWRHDGFLLSAARVRRMMSPQTMASLSKRFCYYMDCFFSTIMIDR